MRKILVVGLLMIFSFEAKAFASDYWRCSAVSNASNGEILVSGIFVGQKSYTTSNLSKQFEKYVKDKGYSIIGAACWAFTTEDTLQKSTSIWFTRPYIDTNWEPGTSEDDRPAYWCDLIVTRPMEGTAYFSGIFHGDRSKSFDYNQAFQNYIEASFPGATAGVVGSHPIAQCRTRPGPQEHSIAAAKSRRDSEAAQWRHNTHPQWKQPYKVEITEWTYSDNSDQ